MKLKNILATSATCAFLLVGCGGGSGSNDDTDANDNSDMDSMDAEEDSDSDNTNVLTGVFLDSAVVGASYATETLTGETNDAGEFSYLEGESVTFSVGSLTFPTVPAAEQVSPVDIASGSADPSATSTNIARLLQSLDDDGNPDNGIVISAGAAAMATLLNFDVSTTEFENNADVINLVAGSGSVTTSLISAEAANQHLNETLNGPTAQTSISGLWARGEAGAPGFDGYLDIGSTSLVQYNVGERDTSSIALCYEASTIAITNIGGDLYDIDGQDENVNFVRVGDNLEVTPDGDSTRVYPLVQGLDTATLPMCSGNADNNQNVDNGQNVTLTTLAGFYDSTVNGIRQHYLLINSDGTATEYERGQEGGNCFDIESWQFSSLGEDLFRLERPNRDAEELRIARQNGDLILNSDSNNDRVVFPRVTSPSPSELQACS